MSDKLPSFLQFSFIELSLFSTQLMQLRMSPEAVIIADKSSRRLCHLTRAFMSRAAAARIMNVKLADSTFGTVGGDVLSNNTTTINNSGMDIPLVGISLRLVSVPGSSNSLSYQARGYMPASTILFGRDPDLEFIIEHLVWEPESAESKRARFALLGPDISWQEMRIAPLDPEASRQLYTEIDREASNDQKLSELLDMLGHMPLAVKLMARQGRSTGCTVEELMKSYLKNRHRHARSNPQIRQDPYALELLSRISMLAAGTTFQVLERWWAPDIPNLQSALHVLLETALLERRSTMYFVLPVIRLHILDRGRLPSTVRELMVQAACNFLQEHCCTVPGKSSYINDAAARSEEEINLQTILLDTTSSEHNFIQALLTLAWHQYRLRPRTEVIKYAVGMLSDATDQKLSGDVLECHGWILQDLNRFQEALEKYQLARQTYLAASGPRRAAQILLNIAYVSVLIHSETDDIALIKQAMLELENFYHPKPTWSSFGTWFINTIKGVSPKEPSIMDYTGDMARCLQDLGIAYSRRGDHSKAIEHLIRARESYPKLSFEGAYCAQNLALSYHRLRHHNKAEEWGLLSLKEWEGMGNSTISISKGLYEQAVESLSEALELAKRRDDLWNTAMVLVELGRAHMKNGGIEDARASLTEASAHFRQFQGISNQPLIVCRFYLAKLDDPYRVPTEEERRELRITSHDEDIPP
ncbi:hypothetical protein C8J56DRAFT_884330 [Mycena floridula]|nr:hypothetical protein C8J56DRAFT_884330 [Mycena floridula]